MTQALRIVFALYPGVTHLDFTGPQQVLSRIPGAETILGSVDGQPLTTDGVTFANLSRLASVEACEVLCVPGGFGVGAAINDAAFMQEVARLAATASYVTSVCTGSLVLGAAGLLRGRRAACHWAWRDLLEPFGAVVDTGRVVRDGNIFTGGGVTAGIDFALTLAAELAGDDVAQMIELGLEYAPAPPFGCGRPELAPAELVERFNGRMAAFAGQRHADVQSAADRLQVDA